MNITNIITQINGHWLTLFNRVGLDIKKNQHSPCPLCGGKDRFRFDDIDGRGTWICNQCGAGDGLELLKRYQHCNTKEAIETAADYLGISLNDNYVNHPPKENEEFAEPIKRCNQEFSDTLDATQSTTTRTREKSYDYNNELLQKTSVANKVTYLLDKTTLGQSDYLTCKGLTYTLPLLDNGSIFVPVIDIHGNYRGGQFIEANGQKRLLKGTHKNGAFIKVRKSFDDFLKADFRREFCDSIKKEVTESDVIICEGLATAITLSLIKPNAQILAAIDAGNLIHVARSIKILNPNAHIIIAGDNDAHLTVNTGRDKAIKAAEAVNGYYAIPDTDNKCDWDDYRQQQGLTKTAETFNSAITQYIQPREESLKKNSRSSMNLSQMASSQRAQLLKEHYDNNLAINLTSDEIYHYHENIWRPISDKVLKRRLVELFEQSGEPYNPLRITSSVDSLRLSLPAMGESPKGVICFKNGIYNPKTKQFTEHCKGDWITTNNEINYYPAKGEESLDTNAPNFAKWLHSASGGDDEKSKNILAALYMILANRYDWQLFLEITGAGGSGKSVFADIATLLAGKENTTATNMASLDSSRERAIIVGKSLIILPDQPRYVGGGDGLKAITGNDIIQIDPKYKQSYDCKIPAVVLVINNEAMRFTDRTGAVSRRRIIFHFGNIIPKHERDYHLVSKIEQELPTIVRLLLAQFPNPEEAKIRLESQRGSCEANAIKREADHLIDFCSYLIAQDEPNGMLVGNLGITPFNPRKYLFHAYNEYMRNTGLTKPLSLTQFGLSMDYAVKENGKEYKKKRIAAGMRTNLELNLDTSCDWLPRSDDPNHTTN
ncbi:primase-helicase zinc-binding domain-containing protein [Orbaceae bacterium ESL0721]|nr:primase-helicase zinc-binding domain-containing protein [Orbaceae bacterium ESL0721]